MKKVRLVIFASLMLETVTIGAMAPKSPKSNKTYAIIVSGINKDPKEQQAKDHVLANLRTFLLNHAGVEPDRLAILTGRPSPVHKDLKLSTAENLRDQINTFAAVICPADQFIFYYVGQANVVAQKLRLNLPGKDITHEQLTAWIERIKADSMLIVLDCPGAGLAVKALAGKNRIFISACTDEQVYSTQFSKYFIPALTDFQNDVDSNGKISVLEAFTATARQLDESYRRQNLLQTETPVLEDNGDGVASLQPWRFREENTDGLAASRCFLSRE